MGSNSFGRRITMTSFGESHGAGIGVVLDDLPAGFELNLEQIQEELNRRKPGQNAFVSPRQEPDTFEVLSGLYEGKTTGAPLTFFVRNHNAQSQDYAPIQDWWRPGHADAVYDIKYGIRDHRGGGRASARETLARVLAGAVAKQMLGRLGLSLFAYTKSIGDYQAQTFDRTFIEKNPFRVADANLVPVLEQYFENLREEKDSIGGVLELQVHGLPAGLGQPIFDKLSACIAKAMMSLPAVKALEFGEGIHAASMKASEHNDAWLASDEGPQTQTNHAGGIVGGISTGAPLVCRLTFKAPSSIAQKQQSLNRFGVQESHEVQGRHDPCVVPRAVPVAEAMMAWVLLDHYLLNMGTKFSDVEDFYWTPSQKIQDVHSARKHMDRLDESLIKLLAKRLAWAKKIIQFRQSLGSEKVDFSREKIMKEHHETWAKKYGVPVAFVLDFFAKIMDLGKKD